MSCSLFRTGTRKRFVWPLLLETTWLKRVHIFIWPNHISIWLNHMSYSNIFIPDRGLLSRCDLLYYLNSSSRCKQLPVKFSTRWRHFCPQGVFNTMSETLTTLLLLGYCRKIILFPCWSTPTTNLWMPSNNKHKNSKLATLYTSTKSCDGILHNNCYSKPCKFWLKSHF